jgi:hypothetical protein
MDLATADLFYFLTMSPSVGSDATVCQGPPPKSAEKYVWRSGRSHWYKKIRATKRSTEKYDLNFVASSSTAVDAYEAID